MITRTSQRLPVGEACWEEKSPGPQPACCPHTHPCLGAWTSGRSEGPLWNADWIADPLPAPLQGTLSPQNCRSPQCQLPFCHLLFPGPSISAHVCYYISVWGCWKVSSLFLWLSGGENRQQEQILENLDNSLCGMLEIKHQRKKGIIIMNKGENGKDF